MFQATLGSWPVVDDLRAELVPHDNVTAEIHVEYAPRAAGRLDELLGVLKGVEVRAADPASKSLDQHLARAWLGGGDIVNDELLVSHHGSAHSSISWSFPFGRLNL